MEDNIYKQILLDLDLALLNNKNELQILLDRYDKVRAAYELREEYINKENRLSEILETLSLLDIIEIKKGE